MAIARDNSPEATRTNDERTPLIPPKDQAIREEDVDDPTQMPKGRRNMILVAVWLGVFVSLSLSSHLFPLFRRTGSEPDAVTRSMLAWSARWNHSSDSDIRHFLLLPKVESSWSPRHFLPPFDRNIHTSVRQARRHRWKARSSPRGTLPVHHGNSFVRFGTFDGSFTRCEIDCGNGRRRTNECQLDRGE